MLYTEKQNIILNEVCVNRYFDLVAACWVLQQKTQNFTYFDKVGTSEEFCKKMFFRLEEQRGKLSRHIEYLTHKRVKELDEDGVVYFTDGSKMKITR